MKVSEPEGKLITSSKEIQSILSRLIERSTPITVHPEESSSQLTTYLESIDLKNNILLLDAPLPAFRHCLLHNRKLIFTTRYNGCLLTVVDVQMTVIEGDETSRFSSMIPKNVYLLQRRESYRVPVRPLLDILTKLSLIEEASFSGRLKDLSVGGCCIEFSGDMSIRFQYPEEVLPLIVSFPNGTEVAVNIKVLRAEFNASKETTLIGCCFVELTANLEQYMNKIVGDLQRDFISHSRGSFSEIPALFIPQQKTSVDEKVATDNENKEDLSPPKPIKSLSEQLAPVDIKKAYLSALSAVKSLINHFRANKDLPIEQAKEACFHLLTAWKQDRQALIILSRQRNVETYLLQHSISYAMTFVDLLATQFQKQSSDELLERVLLGGLCHHVAQASLPEGLQHYELLMTENDRAEHVGALNRLMDQLNKLADIASETRCIVTDVQEFLDGSGIPNNKSENQLNRVSKLAAAIYAHEKLSHKYYKDDWYFHPFRAFKQLIELPDKYHTPSIRMLLKSYGKYPLGSCVRLSDQTVALVMRQNDQGYPSYLRVVYNLAFDSLVPPRDIHLSSIESLQVEAIVNPVSYRITSKLLKLPLKE